MINKTLFSITVLALNDYENKEVFSKHRLYLGGPSTLSIAQITTFFANKN